MSGTEDGATPAPDGEQTRYLDADPSWYPRVLRTLARDYPEISEKVWRTAVSENATEQIEKYGL